MMQWFVRRKAGATARASNCARSESDGTSLPRYKAVAPSVEQVERYSITVTSMPILTARASLAASQFARRKHP